MCFAALESGEIINSQWLFDVVKDIERIMHTERPEEKERKPQKHQCYSRYHLVASERCQIQTSTDKVERTNLVNLRQAKRDIKIADDPFCATNKTLQVE